MRDDDTVIPVDSDLSPTDPGEPVLGRRRHVPRRRHDRARPDVLAVIALGGMLGATARFKLAEALPVRAGHFPWATFWTTLSGSFLLGFLLILLLERFPPTRYVRPFETALLIKDGHQATAFIYGLGSLAAGIFLAYAGIVAAEVRYVVAASVTTGVVTC